MNKNYRAKKSQENWKNKAMKRSVENCDLKKKIKRLEENDQLKKLNHSLEVELLKSEIKKAIDQYSEESKINKFTNSYQKIRVLCVQLLIVGVIPFRAVPRVFKIMGDSIGIKKIAPHFTSVINWTLRSGIGIFKTVSPVEDPWIAVIDMSNITGTRKILVVQRILVKTLSLKGKAIALEDSECVGIISKDVWNGETIRDALDEVFKKVGMPVGILKDQGSDLKKGVRLYCEKNKFNKIIIINDIGHTAANALKAEFEKDPQFIKFLELIKTSSLKIRQTIVAWALPPKIRSKGRFQGITKLADWAQDMLAILDGQNDGITPEEMVILSKEFSELIELRVFVDNFIVTCDVVEQMLKIMKNKGLNKTTGVEVKNILSKLSAHSKTNKRLSEWLINHENFQLKLGLISLLVSSDIIESLFGKFKSIIQRSPKAELNKLIYVIPLLCGKRSDQEIGQALLKCSHGEMKEYILEKIPTTIRQQRIKLLKKTKNRVPNLGNFTSEKAA